MRMNNEHSKWEYLQVVHKPGDRTKDEISQQNGATEPEVIRTPSLLAHLNELGRDGWELHTVSPYFVSGAFGNGVAAGSTYLLRRQIKE